MLRHPLQKTSIFINTGICTTQPLAKQPGKQLALPTHEVSLSENLGGLDNRPTTWMTLPPLSHAYFLLLCFKSVNNQWAQETPDTLPLDQIQAEPPSSLSLLLSMLPSLPLSLPGTSLVALQLVGSNAAQVSVSASLDKRTAISSLGLHNRQMAASSLLTMAICVSSLFYRSVLLEIYQCYDSYKIINLGLVGCYLCNGFFSISFISTYFYYFLMLRGWFAVLFLHS